MPRYKRPCLNCGELYAPNDKHGKQCDFCKEQAKVNANISRIKTQALKKKEKDED